MTSKGSWKQARHADEKVYTLVPEAFDWEALIASPHPFHGNLFRGHFERGGILIAAQVLVRPVRSIVFRKLEIQGAHPENWSGLIFGSSQQLFLAHEIAGRPDFDQLLEVSEPTPLLLNALGSRTTVPIDFPGVNASAPLIPAPGLLSAFSPRLGPEPLKLTIQSEAAIEFDDLAL